MLRIYPETGGKPDLLPCSSTGRASDSGSEGSRFESLQGNQKSPVATSWLQDFFLFHDVRTETVLGAGLQSGITSLP